MKKRGSGEIRTDRGEQYGTRMECEDRRSEKGESGKRRKGMGEEGEGTIGEGTD